MPAPEFVTYDVSLVDRVSRHRGWELRNKGKARDQSRHTQLPEDLMSDLEQYIGDGKARVTVSSALAHSKEFGNKAEAFVSISVTCNNDLEDVDQVHALLHPKVEELVNEDLEDMKVDRDRHLSGVRTAKRTAKKAGASSKRVASPPKKTGATKAKPKTGKGPRRPNFRRS